MTATSIAQDLLAVICGGFVSFSLGLVGGGGSIIAVPLILYVVGLPNVHVAIGTAALAVATSASLNITPHARAGHVRWGPAFAFATSGVLGATLGSSAGKLVDGRNLLVYFAFLMCVVGILTLWKRSKAYVTNTGPAIPYVRLLVTGLGAGGLSGLFGIGGGFLIVPGLMFAGRMAMVDAIGTSLVAIGFIALTTAINYALSGQVDYAVAMQFVAGGVIGGAFGARLSSRLAQKRGTLNVVFSVMIFALAAYMFVQSSR
jgi:uncharacterized membrane protein YfcA